MGARRFPSLNWPLALLLATGVFMHSSYAETISFDTDAVGSLPDSWVEGVTGRGTPRWTVESDASAPSKPNVLKQSGAGTFPWCVRHGTSIEDGFVEVKFKALAGNEDRAGGVVLAEDQNRHVRPRGRLRIRDRIDRLLQRPPHDGRRGWRGPCHDDDRRQRRHHRFDHGFLSD